MNMYHTIAEKKLEFLKKTGQYREFININRINKNYPLVYINSDKEKEAVVWCSNDYLGMSQHPLVISAMNKAINEHGAGSGGSRNIGGTHSYYLKLKKSIADWHGKELSLVFPTGYSSNDATLQCLLRVFDNCTVFSDELNHASIINGIRSTPVKRKIFKHNDVSCLEALLAVEPINCPKIIVFESIYSMDGDIAPIKDIIALAKKY
ncbi:5-aminolevulinate synthase [Piscirickettsia salmonis]|uniref:5-aminolevulinate synthase n=2 Tax=Piscirickettsia salmonis TaxID=1238 RepID=A0AAC9EUN8_PISSA|nr:aminotransferase class I/II-fold pyridoxal phosphate-dependent enzyme [Piscirickettsia salmonis]ALB21841.1 5-aminolevulinate synthase [Piscirickettsia salmonis]ALT18179.1 hypothetical protein PSLF89_1177 [Piscirickettsia salmonis LF-89 = ATCC VR-1361]ALY02019.1 hypothetical protein AWE47_03320 [Piscirickettsia salmonis]AMA41530.1 hypothetical protein AWJ11_03315 [Piscirickettsia salmonis]AOS34015.1 hypothetical protein AVM72_00555 [Piscirickettsia salmonis]